MKQIYYHLLKPQASQVEKVSVIIPSCNSSSYILEAVESALAQTYGNLEVIVADDASRDDTREIVNGIRDPRVKLIARAENGGAAAARNTAIRAAAGRYIAFLDSDDYWMPDKLAVQVGRMQEEEKDFSYTSYLAKSGNREVLIDVPDEIDYPGLLRGNIICTSTAVYDSRKLGKIYMPDLAMRQDFATWLNVLQKCNSALGIRQPMSCYRRRQHSLSSRFARAMYFNYRVYRQTQGCSPGASCYFLFRHLLQALQKRLDLFHRYSGNGLNG